MIRIRLIHWSPAEARQRAGLLRELGYEVDDRSLDPASLRVLGQEAPGAVVIDLTRLPSHGRDVALALRKTRATRHIPLVFTEGDPEKLRRIMRLLPDAAFTTWHQIGAALAKATNSPLTDPVVPASIFAGYANVPLSKKLGIKPGTELALIEPPAGFDQALQPLPQGAVLRRGDSAEGDLAIWFVRSRERLERQINRIARTTGPDGLWIAWPKKAAGAATDLTQAVVRGIGLASGLVDYKICAIDSTWSGLRFTRRKPKEPK
jgi:CheY-like chemotaxis protein